MKTQYDKKTDQHIYGITDGAETPENWVNVALAALDQVHFTEDRTGVIEGKRKYAVQAVQTILDFANHE